jgi:calcineurin-like phosphoesterase family protein
MNQTIVDNINTVVKEDDILFHLGDWSFNGIENILKFRQQIKCKNVNLILGNHDEHIENNKIITQPDGYFIHSQDLFDSINQYLELEIKVPNGKAFNKHKFTLFHYPIASWKDMNKGVIHLHGHVHLNENKKLSAGKAMDVGVDGNSYKPYSLNDIIGIMGKQPIKKLILPNDHHEIPI